MSLELANSNLLKMVYTSIAAANLAVLCSQTRSKGALQTIFPHGSIKRRVGFMLPLDA
jgi:hypothetical protein